MSRVRGQQNTPADCDRRGLLRRLGLAAGAGGAAVLAGPLLGGESAQAADGQSVLLGRSNTADTFTQITNTVGSTSGLWVVNGTRSGQGNSGAIVGDSTDSCGVVGMSETNFGVNGISSQTTGVVGLCLNGTAAGVQGSGLSFGVEGIVPTDGVGVLGKTDSGTGVEGLANAGTAVLGNAVQSGGTGVEATAVSGATALKVSGVARFSRSGSALVAPGKASIVVSGVALDTTSMILATIQQAADGNAISSAVPHPATASFTITLFKPAAVRTKIAWFVLN